MNNVILAISAIFASLGAGSGKAEPQTPIVTDRPDFTESAFVVPHRWLQLESGFTYQRIPGGSVVNGAEALLRYGISPRTELRIGLPDYAELALFGNKVKGYTDGSIGFKFEADRPVLGFDVAAIVETTIPTRDEFSTRTSDPQVKVSYSRSLGDKWGISGMTAGAWNQEDGKRKLYVQQTVALSRELTDSLGVFIEYAGTFNKDIRPDHIAHGGFALRTSRNSQVDIHFGYMMSGSDRMPFIGAGYSVRF